MVSGGSGVGLPPLYSLFGKVVKGLEIVDEMQRVDTDRSDKPKVPVVINSVAISVAD
ncbi:MAG: peptidylprolyl isomerase [Ilumatobacteraceae bacterium]